MDDDLNHSSDVHSSRTECLDAFIAAVGGGYGLIVHDGGSSIIEIKYCPWCGTKLSVAEATDSEGPTAKAYDLSE